MRGGCEMSSACMQGGLPRPLGGYQANAMLEPHSPPSAWQFHSHIPKQENERNDSGINSASDQSSSPGSEHGADFSTQPNVQNFYSTPIRPPMYNMGGVQYAPPSPSPQFLNSPSCSKSEPDLDATLTQPDEDPLKRLQQSMEKNLLPQSLSPKASEHSNDDESRSDNDEFDENGIRVPRLNSHGKIKTFKCKQCDFVAITKVDFWEHSIVHIKKEKVLKCPQCAFVTEYKHHLEYHLRNHSGSKPFKCDKCSYSCVNKSMLNSHLKSHSNVYQYRCADCNYATKYCHSLKIHLRKYTHKPAMVLNPDGTPNPFPIIDVYGTRRGPKARPDSRPENTPPQQPQPQINPFQFQQFMMSPQAMPIPLALPWLQSQLLLRNIEQLTRSNVEDSTESNTEALDLTQNDSRRRSESTDDEDEEMTTTVFDNVEVVHNESNSSEAKEKSNNNNNEKNCCQYCNINFGDAVLYTIHMGYHGYKDPFACNMCGEECKDKVSFFLHIARTPHN